MYVLTYIDDDIGFMVHRWDEGSKPIAMKISKYCATSSQCRDVKLTLDGSKVELLQNRGSISNIIGGIGLVSIPEEWEL